MTMMTTDRVSRSPAPAPARTVPRGTVTREDVYVTWQMANEWLQHRDTNRNIRDPDVDRYYEMMVTDCWYEELRDPVAWTNQEPPVFADGQHRFLAQVKAKKNYWYTVRRGVPPEMVDVIDTGIFRTLQDVFVMKKYSNVRNLIAVARKAWLWDMGKHYQVGGSLPKPSHPEMLRYAQLHPELCDATKRGMDLYRARTLLKPGVAGFAYYLFRNINARDAERFCTGWIRLVDLYDNHPILWLNDYLASSARRKLAGARRSADTLAHTIIVWNHFRDDEPLARITTPRTGWSEGNFPTPH